MSRRIFIDCDDTLILWDVWAKAPLVWEEMHYYINEPLMQRIKNWHEAHPEDTFFVWSWGGLQYANMWNGRLRLAEFCTSLEKDDTLIRPGDIVVDDDWKERSTHLPHEEWE